MTLSQREPWTGRQIRTGLWIGLVLLLGLIQYAGRASSGTPDRNALYLYSTAVGGAIAYAIIALATLGGVALSLTPAESSFTPPSIWKNSLTPGLLIKTDWNTAAERLPALSLKAPSAIDR